MINKNLDQLVKQRKIIYPVYSFLISIYYFFRFVFFTIIRRSIKYLRYFPGHYSSPIPSRVEITKNKERIFGKKDDQIEGINLNKQNQIKLLESFYKYSSKFDFTKEPCPNRRYHYDNPMFGYNDAFVLYSFLNAFKPKKLIEAGSGYSSALILDTLSGSDSLSTQLTFIEPNPGRLNMLIDPDDRRRVNIIEKDIQDVSVELFKELERDDILFVDTSHVMKIHSDLYAILFSILPVLKKGVLIHFHDIFWPFEYPSVILEDGRLWNESYFLRAFLQYNDSFEIVFFSSYLENFHFESMVENIPEMIKGTGSSLWLRKIKE